MRPTLGLSILVLFLFAGMAHAATISGATYDGLSLEVIKNTVVTISSTPVQTKLATDGMYSFIVGPGAYTLRATYSEQGNVITEARQNIVVNQDGNYTIDLILLPDLGDIPDDALPGDTGNPTWVDQLVRGPLLWLGLLGFILVAIGFAFRTIRKNNYKHVDSPEGAEKLEKNNQKNEVEEEQLDKYAIEILDHLKRGGNRTTQKDLRGMMSIGEAKVSLVVSELESYGLVKKIKRGRGNILILTEKGRAHIEKNSHPKKESATSSDADEKLDPSEPAP